nr:hypothetical protein [Tanacetum cinerariifolium]
LPILLYTPRYDLGAFHLRILTKRLLNSCWSRNHILQTEDEAPIEAYILEVASMPTPSLPPSFLSSWTPPLLPIPLLVPSTSRRAEILEADTSPQKRLMLTAPRPGCEVGESSAAADATQLRPTMARSVDCSFVDTMGTRFRDINDVEDDINA